MTSPVAIVTGSSRGIGRAIARRLATEKWRVVVNYVSRPDAAQAVVDEIVAEGGEALAIAASVADSSDRQRLLAATLAAWGRVDLLVNNAGITSPGRKDLLEATEDGWDAVLGTNLKGPFFLSQATAKEMMRLMAEGKISAGKIINVSSISAYAASTNRADYCIAKAGLEMMTWLLADRLASENIQVFEICPGVIASDMTAPVQEKYDQLIAAGLSPIRRWGQPEDVAKAVSAIVADYFPFTTGQRLHIDGGFHIRRLS